MATFGFGAAANTTANTLSFGAKPATSTPATNTGFGALTGFGSPFSGTTQSNVAAVAPQTSTLFGGQPGATAAPATGLFGASTPGSSQPQQTQFGAAATTTTQAGLSFGAQGSLFGSTSTSTTPATTTAGLFGASGFGSPAKPTGLFGGSIGTPGLSFGVTSTNAASISKTATTSSFTLGGTPGLFGKPTSGLGQAPGQTQGQPLSGSIGLGGVDTTAPGSGLTGLSGLAGGAAARQETKTVKENPIPNEVAQSVESFKQYVKQQKSLSCEVARCSAKPLQRVQEDTDAMKQVLASVSAGLQRCRSIADKLKADTAKGLQHTEMAQRTHDTPPGLQYDNTAPLQYFAELVSGFERDIQLFRQEIENAERHVHSQCQTTALTPAELTQAMRRLYDSFVALGGRLHTIHSQVKAQKEQYLSIRKYMLNDPTDVFEEAARNKAHASSKQSHSSSRTTAGPTPFSTFGAPHGFGLLSAAGAAAAAAAAARPTFPSVAPLGWNQSSNTQTPGLSTSFSPQPVDNSPFQLQKPPAGNKRGKR